MDHILDFFCFQILPYISILVLVLGSILRYDQAPYSWRTKSSQLLRRKQLVTGSILFHSGILVVLLGHFAGFFTPIALLEWLGIPFSLKQLIAMIVGGTAGVVSWVGLTLLVHRRLFDARIRAQSSFADIAIVLMLWLQLSLGLATLTVSAQHMDGHVMHKFMEWAQHIVTFRPDAWTYIQDVHWIYKLHINVGFLIFIVFPFTRLVHMFSVPVRYAARPYQIVRQRES